MIRSLNRHPSVNHQRHIQRVFFFFLKNMFFMLSAIVRLVYLAWPSNPDDGTSLHGCPQFVRLCSDKHMNWNSFIFWQLNMCFVLLFFLNLSSTVNWTCWDFYGVRAGKGGFLKSLKKCKKWNTCTHLRHIHCVFSQQTKWGHYLFLNQVLLFT